MPSNHLILCHPLLLLPSIFPSIRAFSNESVIHIRWPKYWSKCINSNKFSLGASFLKILFGKMLQQNKRTNQKTKWKKTQIVGFNLKEVANQSSQRADLENNQANNQEQRRQDTKMTPKPSRKKGEGNKWYTNTAEHLETLNITEWKLGKRKKSTLKKFNSTINEYILTNIDF